MHHVKNQPQLEQCTVAIPFDDNELGLAKMVMTERVFKGINSGNKFDPPPQWGLQPRLSGALTQL